MTFTFAGPQKPTQVLQDGFRPETPGHLPQDPKGPDAAHHDGGHGLHRVRGLHLLHAGHGAHLVRLARHQVRAARRQRQRQRADTRQDQHLLAEVNLKIFLKYMFFSRETQATILWTPCLRRL